MRRHFTCLIGLTIAGLALVTYVLLAPYLEGHQKTRVLAVTPNLVLGLSKPYQPIAILSEKDAKDLFDRIHLACKEREILDLSREYPDLVELERSLRFVDFSEKCVIIIPVTCGYDCKVTMRTPHLTSKTLTCKMAVTGPPWWEKVRHPASHTESYIVAVNRTNIEKIEVWIRGERVSSIALE